MKLIDFERFPLLENWDQLVIDYSFSFGTLRSTGYMITIDLWTIVKNPLYFAKVINAFEIHLKIYFAWYSAKHRDWSRKLSLEVVLFRNNLYLPWLRAGYGRCCCGDLKRVEATGFLFGPQTYGFVGMLAIKLLTLYSWNWRWSMCPSKWTWRQQAATITIFIQLIWKWTPPRLAKYRTVFWHESVQKIDSSHKGVIRSNHCWHLNVFKRSLDLIPQRFRRFDSFKIRHCDHWLAITPLYCNKISISKHFIGAATLFLEVLAICQRAAIDTILMHCHKPRDDASESKFADVKCCLCTSSGVSCFVFFRKVHQNTSTYQSLVLHTFTCVRLYTSKSNRKPYDEARTHCFIPNFMAYRECTSSVPRNVLKEFFWNIEPFVYQSKGFSERCQTVIYRVALQRFK